MLPAALRQHSIWFYAAGLLVCCAPFVMRLTVICNFPATDEGYYAFHAMLAHNALSNSGNLPPLGPLHIYPILLSFLFSYDINHLIALRLCDLVMAVLMAWQWYRLMEEESNGLWVGFFLALLAVFAFNHSLFAQYGFKNSIGVSFIFLILALRIGLNDNAKTQRIWIICGALTAVAVLFREALAPFAVIGFLSILIGYGRRAAILYAFGGIIVTVFILACLAIARGGLTNILEAYYTFSAMARESGKLTAQSVQSLKASLEAIGFLVPIGGILLLGGILTAMRGGTLPWRALFWLAIAVTPLFEVFTKGGYPYHYSTCLLGLSGLAACLFRTCREFAPRAVSCTAIMAFASALFLAYPQAVELPRQMVENLRRLPLMLFQASWPDDMVARSNYLLMARAIADAAKPPDTLMTSGHYFILYPLTGLLPPKTDNHLFDPGLLALARKLSPDALRNRITAENPNIIVLSHRLGTGADVLGKALTLLPGYKKVAEIPIDITKDYGGFSGSIYARTNERNTLSTND